MAVCAVDLYIAHRTAFSMVLSAEGIKEHLRGVAVGLLTPFNEDLDVNHEHLANNAQSLYDEGINTFLAAANISEYHSLTFDERIQVIETCVDALPAQACVLAGVGGNTGDAQQLIRAYSDIGADAMMVMPPDHTYIHEQGLLQYYRKLSDATQQPLVPYVKGFNPSVEYLADLTRIDTVIGIKYALEDPVKLGDATDKGADDVVWVNGLAEPYAVAFWAEGVEGFSAGVSNFRPEVGLALYDALQNENWQKARSLRNICLPFQQLRDGTGKENSIPGAISVPVVKKGLELAGRHGGYVREPITPLDPENESRAEALYQQLDDNIHDLVH